MRISPRVNKCSMFANSIYDNPFLMIAFELQSVAVSALVDGSFGKKWKPWKLRYIALREDGSFVIRKSRKSSISALYSFDGVRIERLSVSNQRQLGVLITCTQSSIETRIRCVFTEAELDGLVGAIKRCVRIYDIDSTEIRLNIHSPYDALMLKYVPIARHSHSAMRSAITSAMDSFDDDACKRHMVNRRGALKWLPPLFANDLVHGSWWFTLGSAVMLMMAIIVFVNGLYIYIGEDDSTLSLLRYEATWGLMAVSGLFFTLGSLVFVRATHESPPMQPLFSWYHVQNDELLASWLFLFATLPFVPYFLIFLADTGSIIFIGALIATFLLIGGSFLFVLACYPTSTKNRREYIMPILRLFVWICFSDRFISLHLANDWLAGTWLIFWGSFFATIASLGPVAIAEGSLQEFIYISGFLENLFFLIGSAYFVAGSYPEREVLEQECADEDKVENDRIDNGAIEYECDLDYCGSHEPLFTQCQEQYQQPLDNPASSRVLSVNGILWENELQSLSEENSKYFVVSEQLSRVSAVADDMQSHTKKLENDFLEIRKSYDDLLRRRFQADEMLVQEILFAEAKIQDLISLKLEYVALVGECQLSQESLKRSIKILNSLRQKVK